MSIDSASQLTASPHRRWFQFSLRTLLVLVLLCAIPCARFSCKLQKAHRRQLAVATIRQHGGYVMYDYQEDFVQASIEAGYGRPKPGVPDAFGHQPAHAPWLVKLLGVDYFASVVSVELMHDADTVFLADLPDVRILSLGGGSDEFNTEIRDFGFYRGNQEYRVTDEGLSHIVGLRNLQDLAIYNSAITDDGFHRLTQIPSLRILTLPYWHEKPMRRGPDRSETKEDISTKVTEQTVEKIRNNLRDCEIRDLESIYPEWMW